MAARPPRDGHPTCTRTYLTASTCPPGSCASEPGIDFLPATVESACCSGSEAATDPQLLHYRSHTQCCHSRLPARDEDANSVSKRAHQATYTSPQSSTAFAPRQACPHIPATSCTPLHLPHRRTVVHLHSPRASSEPARLRRPWPWPQLWVFRRRLL